MSDPARRADAPAPPSSLLERLRHRDHTRGSILGSVVALALPAILMSTIGAGLFQLVDLRFLAVLGDSHVAAAGATNQTLRQACMLLILGLSVASQTIVARRVGQGQLDAAEHAAGQSFVLGAFVALLALLTVGLFPESFVSLFARDPAVLALGSEYAQIVFLTMGVMIAGQVFTAVLNGAGDATTPMIVAFLVTPVSIVAEWCLAFGHLGMPALGIRGIALGAAVGGACGVGVALWALFAGRCRVHLRARHLVPDWALLRRMLGLAWPPALHMVARTLIVVFFMALAGQLGGKVQAAYTIGLRLEMLVIMIAFPIANSCATLVGQNLGSGDRRRAWQAVWVSGAVELAALWPCALALFVFRREVVAFFTSDPEVAAMAVQYVSFSCGILVFYGLYFVAFRTLQAAGDMRSPMLISVGSAVLIGAPLGWLLATRTELGATGMWIANFVHASVNASLMIGWLLTGRWARRAASLE